MCRRNYPRIGRELKGIRRGGIRRWRPERREATNPEAILRLESSGRVGIGGLGRAFIGFAHGGGGGGGGGGSVEPGDMGGREIDRAPTNSGIGGGRDRIQNTAQPE